MTFRLVQKRNICPIRGMEISKITVAATADIYVYVVYFKNEQGKENMHT